MVRVEKMRAHTLTNRSDQKRFVMILLSLLLEIDLLCKELSRSQSMIKLRVTKMTIFFILHSDENDRSN